MGSIDFTPIVVLVGFGIVCVLTIAGALVGAIIAAPFFYFDHTPALFAPFCAVGAGIFGVVGAYLAIRALR